MRVDLLCLRAFGHYQDTELDLSRPERGLTVVHGPNEAGKSTARRALLAAFFGIERGSPDAHRVGPHGLHVGARVRSSDGTALAFARHGLSRLEGEGGAPVEEGTLDRFLGGIEPAAYRRLFAIDHDELRRGSESLLEADGEIGRLVFGASLGAGSVAAVLRRLDERAAALYRDRGSAQRIPRALAAYRDGMRQARESRVRARDWERLRQGAEEVARRLDEVRRAFEEARAEQLRLIRVRSTRPLVARRQALVRQLDGLGAVTSAPWAERASDALARYRQAGIALERGIAARDGLATQVAGISVPEAVLAAAPGIDDLVRGAGRYEKDTGDLPKRRTEQEVAHQAVREQLQRLGMAADDGCLVADSDLVAVEELARQQVATAAEERTATAELRRARARVAEARAHLAELPEPADVALLSRVLELSRPRLEMARSLTAERAEQAAAAEDLAHRAARLGLASLDRDRIEALEVPSTPDVDAERDRRQACRVELGQIDQELERLVTAVAGFDRQIAAAVTEAPDPERLHTARVHRDHGWRVVRATIEGLPADLSWAQGRPLAEAYEVAVADADEAADERYDHADVVAEVIQLRARREESEGERRAREARRRALADADVAASAAWTARWSRLGVEAGPPEAMARWLVAQGELVAAIGRWRQQEAKLSAWADDVDRQAKELAAALAGLGEASCSERLDLLVVQASEIVDRARSATEERHGAVAELASAEREVPQREADLQHQLEARERWRGSWEAAVRPLGLTASTSTEAALAAVAARRRLAAARATAASLERRIRGIEDDCRSYEERVAGVAFGLLPDPDGRTPLGTVSELQRQVTGARAAYERRHALEGQLAEAVAAAQRAAAALDGASRALSDQRVEAALPVADEEPDTGLDTVIARAREAASLREKLAETEDALLEQGDGRSVEQLEAEVPAAGDALDGQIETASAQVDQLQGELERLTSDLTDARRALAAVTDASTAADLEQEAEAELALAAELTTEYAQMALAAEVLRRTITDYGERHRGPLLGRATEVFRALTAGAFDDLVVDTDGDRQVLLAKRADGELCTTAALSDGTRDQLYLALRLAGIEHRLLAADEPLPVVLDDILVHFDDTRTAAALRALGQLGRHTQVLLFTHQARVVEIAERELAPGTRAVVRLAPRRHDLPPAAAGGGRGTPTEDGSAEQRILAAVRAAGGRALGKAELIEHGGVSEGQWPAAIRALVGRGTLVQEGQRRGARYRLGDGS